MTWEPVIGLEIHVQLKTETKANRSPSRWREDTRARGSGGTSLQT